MNRTVWPIGIVFSLALLSACAANAPALPKTETKPPRQFVGQNILESLGSTKDVGVAGVRWWEGFNDPVLNQLVSTSIQNNFQIVAAAARVKEARALLELSEVGDSLLVELDAEVSAQQSDRNNNTASNNPRNERRTSLGFGFTLPIDLAGRVEQEVRAAAANLLVEQAGLRAQIIQTSTAVAQEYLSLLGNQKQLAMLRESVELQEKTLAIVQARFESGLSPELDVRRAETSVETLRASIAPLQQALQDSRHRLATLSGQFPGAYEQLLKPDGDLPGYGLAIPLSVPFQVIQARPDVQLAQARFARAAAEVGVAQADFYPSIELMANIQIGSTAINSNPATSLVIGSLAALLNQVVYDGGARDARLNAALARAEEALAEYEQVLRVVIQEVENSLTAIDSSAHRQTALGKAVVSSKRSFEQADALYQLGLVSFLDVVDAQRVYANAEQALATEQTN